MSFARRINPDTNNYSLISNTSGNLSLDVMEIVALVQRAIQQLRRATNDIVCYAGRDRQREVLFVQKRFDKIRVAKDCAAHVQRLLQRFDEITANSNDKEARGTLTKAYKDALHNLETVMQSECARENTILSNRLHSVRSERDDNDLNAPLLQSSENPLAETSGGAFIEYSDGTQQFSVEDAIRREQLQGLQDIQRELREVQELYKQVNRMVINQQEGIDKLEDSMEQSLTEVQEGVREIEITGERVERRHRRWFFYGFWVVIIIVVILLWNMLMAWAGSTRISQHDTYWVVEEKDGKTIKRLKDGSE